MRSLASVPAYFGLRVLSAVLLLKLSASFLSVTEFTIFTQFMLFVSLLNAASVAGMQNGLIRQAAAAQDPEELGSIRKAAFTIWAAVLPLLVLAVALFSGEISDILVGTQSYWGTVILLALLATAAGPAQIWCSLLSGRKRVASSLGAQAVGQVCGTALAAAQIARGEFVGAAVGYACGSIMTMAIAGLLAARLPIASTAKRLSLMRVVALLRYSAAFAATAGFGSLVLFGLRSFYRETFDPVALGYWMAANRVSDMATQLIGLFMIQFFVPHFAAAGDEAARQSLALRCWAAGVAVMVVGLTVFHLASSLLVSVFLSPAYLPAIPMIEAYLLGDTFRVGVLVAMYSAFARGNPAGYAAIEMSALALMATIVAVLVSAGENRAPQFGYPAAYGIVAAIVVLTVLWRRTPEHHP